MSPCFVFHVRTQAHGQAGDPHLCATLRLQDRRTAMPISDSVDDYLKALYQLAGEDGWVGTSQIAERLGITSSSVTAMLQRLSEGESPHVEYRKGRGARLTAEGRTRAVEMVRHHRLIELYLHQELGYSLDEVHAEAETLEHAISETFEDRLAAKMGHPTIDPHGHPIPSKDGQIQEISGRSLLDLEIGETATVASVSDRDPAILRYLCAQNVVPGARLTVSDKAPFEGPVTVMLEGQAKPLALGRNVASHVLCSTS